LARDKLRAVERYDKIARLEPVADIDGKPSVGDGDDIHGDALLDNDNNGGSDDYVSLQPLH